MEEPGLLSVLPPVLAILVALATRQAVLALLAGVLFGELVLGGGNVFSALAGTVARIADAFSGNPSILLFSTLVGSVLALIGFTGGVTGFVKWVTSRRLVTGPRGAQALALLLGLGIFVESSITCLVSGTVARPLFDRFRVSREKLAYLTDSTSAPVCILLPMNGWGALIITILGTLGIESGVSVLVASIPLNFYALAALGLAFFFGLSGRDFGPMARAEHRARTTGQVIREGGPAPCFHGSPRTPSRTGSARSGPEHDRAPGGSACHDLPRAVDHRRGQPARRGRRDCRPLGRARCGGNGGHPGNRPARPPGIRNGGPRTARSRRDGAGRHRSPRFLRHCSGGAGSWDGGLSRGGGGGGHAGLACSGSALRSDVGGRVFHRDVVGDVRHHAPDCGSGCRRARPRSSPRRGSGALGRDLRRSLLADLGHHDHRLHGVRVRPRGPREHSASVCAAGRAAATVLFVVAGLLS